MQIIVTIPDHIAEQVIEAHDDFEKNKDEENRYRMYEIIGEWLYEGNLDFEFEIADNIIAAKHSNNGVCDVRNNQGL